MQRKFGLAGLAALAAVVLLVVAAGCATTATPPASVAKSKPEPVPLGASFLLSIRVMDHETRSTTVEANVSCRNLTTSTITLTEAQADSLVEARVQGGTSVVASASCPLRWSVKFASGSAGTRQGSAATSLTVPPADTLDGSVKMSLPGTGTYTISARLPDVPGSNSPTASVIVWP